jgi:hypothetical protein
VRADGRQIYQKGFDPLDARMFGHSSRSVPKS